MVRCLARALSIWYSKRVAVAVITSLGAVKILKESKGEGEGQKIDEVSRYLDQHLNKSVDALTRA